MAKWTIKARGKNASKAVIDGICRTFSVRPLAAAVMLNLGLNSMDEIKYYNSSSLDKLHPLSGLENVIRAFKMIEEAINAKQRIVIYGDYDVDGVTSTVILCKGLKALGGNVDYFIPDRHTDGYGLNARAVSEIASKGCDLLITCDNGIAAPNEIAYARELGMKTVIFDHHEPAFAEDENGRRYILPDADVIVDLKVEGVEYPFKDLCAGGLCFKLIRELYAYMGKELKLNDELAVFAALATVCDVVTLLDENRIMVRYGLEAVNRQIDNLGLRKLGEINKLQDRTITEYTFGFVIGPCINAGGRLEVAELSAELFMCEDEQRAEELAERLFELNSIRKEMTSEGCERLFEIADKMTDRVLVLYDEGIDESIAGIVAGRIKERYNKPSIVLTRGEGGAKGSGRSIDAYDMFEELSAYRELFDKFGGHKMAAGMSLPVENIEPLRQGLNKSCRLTEDEMERCFRADGIVRMSDVDLYTAMDMELFKPYGNGNPEPMISAVSLNISRLRFVGAEKGIAQFRLSDSTSNYVSAVMFNAEALISLVNEYYGYDYIDEDRNVKGDLRDIKIDVMANLRADEYNGNTYPKLIIKDIRLTKSK
jgi:single-stranded-DNA-specific exonuclease